MLQLFIDTLKLTEGNALIRDGEFLHTRCCAHILKFIVRNGLTHLRDNIVAIQNVVMYIRLSSSIYKPFELHVRTIYNSNGKLLLIGIQRILC